MQETYTIGPRTFVLDRAKAEAALAAKRVVGGRPTMTFNLLPLRYVWAYELYRTMKANHWEPEDVPMQRDIGQWRDDSALSEIDRWIVRMGIGYFSAAEGIVGDNILHVVRELVTASELKLVLGRHAHEENIHADSLLYMISSLGIDPHECEAMFDDIPTIVAKNAFVTGVSRELRRDLDMTLPEMPSGLPSSGMFDDSVTLTVTAGTGAKFLSFASMLICTNDGFTGVDSLRLPKDIGEQVAVKTNGYDAGTERNTENYADIVQPCQDLHGVDVEPGTGMSNPALAERGVIHHHAGIQDGVDDLTLMTHGWSGPVAEVTVERVS